MNTENNYFVVGGLDVAMLCGLWHHTSGLKGTIGYVPS